MSTTPPKTPAVTRAAAEERLARRRRTLQELSEIGLDLARALERQAQDAAATENPLKTFDELSRAFVQVSQAVRLTIALQARLENDRETLAACAVTTTPEPRAARRRAKVVGAVEQAIEAEVGLHTSDGRELWKRVQALVDREAQMEQFLDRPLGEIIARLCRDLGLRPDWRHWDADWAADARKAAAETPHPRRR